VFNLNLGISIQFISSCMQCYSIFSFEWNLIFTKSIHIFHQLIVTSTQQHKLQAKITTFQKQLMALVKVGKISLIIPISSLPKWF